MSTYSYDYVRNFTGGENSFATPDELIEGELLLCENVDLFGRGGFQRRKGISSHKDLGNFRVDRLIEYEYYNAGSRILLQLALTNGNLVNWNTGTVIKTGLGATLDYEVYKNKLFILSNNLFLVYDGTTIADVTNASADSALATIKKCTFIEQRGQRLFACGNPDAPNALYYSEVGQPDYWKNISIINAISDDADRLTGLKEFHGALIAFKQRTIFAWFGYDPATDVKFQQLSVHTGTRAYRSIQRVGDMLFFLGEDGVYALTGTYENVIDTKCVSRKITPRIKSVKHNTDFKLEAACAVVHDGKYMLSVPVNSYDRQNDAVYVFFNDLLNDAVEEVWSIYTNWNVSDWLKSLDGNLYSGSSVTGKIMLHEQGYADNGAGIPVNVKVRPLSQEAFVHNKKYRRGYVVLKQFEGYNTHITVSAQVDYKNVEVEVSPDESLIWDNDEASWDVSYWDFSELVTRKFNVKEKGKRIVLSVADSTPYEPMVVYGFSVEYKIKKPDRR